MYVVEMRWGIVGLKGCLQRVMAAEKAIMNLMGGQSVPTCVPAFLKVDWSNSVRLVSPLHLSWWWWPDRPTRPPWDETEAAYFPFSPKTTGRKWKRVLHFLQYILYHLFWLSAHPSLPLLFSPSSSHIRVQTHFVRLRMDWIIPFVKSKGFSSTKVKENSFQNISQEH